MIEAKALFQRYIKEFPYKYQNNYHQPHSEVPITESEAIIYAACIVAETISRSMNDEMFDQKVYEKQGGQK